MVDRSILVPIEEVDRGDEDDELSLGRLIDYAVEFLEEKKWCLGIRRGFLGMGYEGVVAVFLFDIQPRYDYVDETLWVVTGDLPPAYLVTDETEHAADALEGYIEEMRLWVEAAEQGKPVDDIIPVNVPPTKEYADMLRFRLDFLEESLADGSIGPNAMYLDDEEE